MRGDTIGPIIPGRLRNSLGGRRRCALPGPAWARAAGRYAAVYISPALRRSAQIITIAAGDRADINCRRSIVPQHPVDRRARPAKRRPTGGRQRQGGPGLHARARARVARWPSCAAAAPPVLAVHAARAAPTCFPGRSSKSLSAARRATRGSGAPREV